MSVEFIDTSKGKGRVGAPPIPPSIYFGGCAFGAAFYVGVIQAMCERWGPDFYKKTMLCGGSAGTIFAIALALGNTPRQINHLYRTVAEKAAKHGTVIYASVFLEEALRELMYDNPMAFKLLEGRCCFGTTQFFSKHNWHISWMDNEDLVETACGSCHIPFYCQRNFGIKEALIVDGAYGFAGKDLPHGNNTLYVGIDPNAEITRGFTYSQMMFPMVSKDYEDCAQSGYDAFMAWDGTLYDYKVQRRRPNNEMLVILWTTKFFEYLYHQLGFALNFILLVLSFMYVMTMYTFFGKNIPKYYLKRKLREYGYHKHYLYEEHEAEERAREKSEEEAEDKAEAD